MLGQQENHNNTIGDDLLKALIICRERHDIGKENSGKVEKLMQEVTVLTQERTSLVMTVNHVKDISKNIQDYVNDKKERSTTALRLAIESAGDIVKDADATRFKLEIEGESVEIVDGEGRDVNEREGSGYRSAMSLLLRQTLMAFQPSALPVIFLDEAVSTLNDASMSELREMIRMLSKHVLIIGIEQRPILFEGLDRVEYSFTKGMDKSTKVRRVDSI